jgi:hypothetical protein
MIEVYVNEDQDTDPQTFHVSSSGDQEEEVKTQIIRGERWQPLQLKSVFIASFKSHLIYWTSQLRKPIVLVRYYSELVEVRNIMNLVKCISKCVVDVKALGTLYVDILRPKTALVGNDQESWGQK